MKSFALIGAAGFVAPRHMKAIKDTGNELVAAVDRHDSVGIIDSYFPDLKFFTEFERFDRHLDKLRRSQSGVDYISITSPNYLHDAHIRYALRNHSHAICEKPLVLNPWNVDALREIENESDKRIYNILQLRLHPDICMLRERVAEELAADPGKVYDIDLTYITSRGNWYFSSWKGEEMKSGGITTNIGVHFFDMLSWIFGDPGHSKVFLSDSDVASGYLELAHARVRWFLSVNADDLPDKVKQVAQRTYRSITINGEEIEFSSGFTDLHTLSYQHILNGDGFGVDDAMKSIEIVHSIRNDSVAKITDDCHPFIRFRRIY